ncbi:MAG: hypothetical protein ACJAVR_001595 [Paracoccaceae bacterium]|jgi:hypothetical protein
MHNSRSADVPSSLAGLRAILIVTATAGFLPLPLLRFAA